VRLTGCIFVDGERFFSTACGRFAVSKTGRVLGRSGRILSNRGSPYRTVSYRTEDKKTRHLYVHRLVAEVWHGVPEDGRDEVNHRDGNKLNNHRDNLEWVTRSGNV
jgi:hypothetical protein